MQAHLQLRSQRQFLIKFVTGFKSAVTVIGPDVSAVTLGHSKQHAALPQKVKDVLRETDCSLFCPRKI